MTIRPLSGFLVLALLLLAGCSSGPKTFVNQDPGADFGSYATFGFPARLGTDDREGYTSLISQYLRDATTRELTARGYQESNRPDLLVNFGLLTKEKIKSTSSPSYGGYYGYRGYGAWGGYDTTVTQYTEGTLTIDLVDASNNQLVWEASAVGRIRDDARENLQGAANEVVALLFQDYAHYAPGYTPPPPPSSP